MSAEIFPVIMAGGRGTRFWPASTRSRPKQFLGLGTGGKSLFEDTFERASLLSDPAGIVVVASVEHAETIMDITPGLARENLLLEPVGRNTAACVAWAAERVRSMTPGGDREAVMVVMPSDHLIRDRQGFASTMARAAGLALDDWLVTTGIAPTHAATGYGYLELGEAVDDSSRLVSSFREKPSPDLARSYVSSGRYLWNAGIFIWRPARILEEIARHLPEVAHAVEELRDVREPSMEVYSAIPSISIDYGVMEKAESVAVVPAAFDWDDMGDWSAARRAGVSMGDSMLVDSGGDVTVWCEDGSLTVLVGVDGISVVRTDGATLVVADGSEQSLREVVEKLGSDRPDLV